MVTMMSTEEGAVALWMREKNQTYWLCCEHLVMSDTALLRFWDGIEMELMGVPRSEASVLFSQFSSMCDVNTPESPQLILHYLSGVFVFSDTCGRYKFMALPPPPSPPQSASGPVIQRGPFKESALINRDGSPPGPFPCTHFRLLGISWQCRANDFLIPIDAQLINLLHNFHGLKLPRGWND